MRALEVTPVARTWAAVIAALMLASAVCFAQVDEAAETEEIVTIPLTGLPQLASAKPRFARLVAAPDYTTALWLILDESQGTDSGHDVVYADFNYDGVIGEGETARGQVRSMGEFAIGSFPALGVPDANDPSQAPGDRPRIALRYQWYRGKSTFTVSTMIRMTGESGRPDDTWQYMISASLRTGTSPGNAPLTRIGGELAVQVQARPDGNRRVQVGIGLTVTVGGSFCDPRTVAGSPDAEVIVRNANGQIVHRAVERLDKFCFG